MASGSFPRTIQSLSDVAEDLIKEDKLLTVTR